METLVKRVFDVEQVRKKFPILQEKIHNKTLVYFDNAATSQKPRVVVEALDSYYLHLNSNIHRAAHYLAAKATQAYEDTREKLKNYLNASATEEILFTRGVTEAVNLVASSWGRCNIVQGDEIILSEMEHHSNIVPWQLLAEEKGAKIRVIPVNDAGELILEEYEKLLNERTKIVSVVHVSNALGTINPVKEIIQLAHQRGAMVFLDGAQANVHLEIDVQDLDCDFYAISAHKVYGPTGIGALYGKKHLLEKMPPYHGGGEMIREVSFEKTTYNDLPHKFEAGTPNIADGIAFKAALDFVDELGKKNISQHEEALLQYANLQLSQIEGLKIIGQAKDKISVISFIVDGVHHSDLGTLLDADGIAIRTGHHCTQPLMKRFGIAGTSRISFAMYNTMEEIDQLIKSLRKAIKMLQ